MLVHLCNFVKQILSKMFMKILLFSRRSYCPDHRPRQATPSNASDRLAFYGTAKSICCICMFAVEARASNDTLRSPCCKNSWFHRDCMQVLTPGTLEMYAGINSWYIRDCMQY